MSRKEIKKFDTETGGKKETEGISVSTEVPKEPFFTLEYYEKHFKHYEEKLNNFKADVDETKKEFDSYKKEFDSYKKEFDSYKKEFDDSLKTTRDTRALVFFGFFALVFVVIGIALGYWQFIFTASKNEDYKYGLSEKINNNLNEIKKLKLCLDSNKWLNPKCFED